MMGRFCFNFKTQILIYSIVFILKEKNYALSKDLILIESFDWERVGIIKRSNKWKKSTFNELNQRSEILLFY